MIQHEPQPLFFPRLIRLLKFRVMTSGGLDPQTGGYKVKGEPCKLMAFTYGL